jgi:enoyl-CoA hydratase
MAEVVRREINAPVATLEIDRPERRNALSAGVIEGIITGIEELGALEEVRVIVLQGAGEKAFCAGGDISDFQAAKGLLEVHWARRRFADLMVAMQNSRVPIIAKVQGAALGGGFGLALQCDLIVASRGATFGTPEIKLGLFPMMIMAVLVRNLGRKRAMEWMLTGRKVDAQTALESGFINRLVDPEDLDNAARELAEEIAGFSPAILQLGRDAFYKTQDMGFEEALSTLHNELTINSLAEDTAEGVMAFLSKRAPDWKGR